MIMDSKFGSFVVQKAFIFTVSKYFYAFVAPNPILRGRNNISTICIIIYLDVLISSKREVSLLSELYNEELFDYSLFLQKISVILEAIYKVSSFTISVQVNYNTIILNLYKLFKLGWLQSWAEYFSLSCTYHS